MKVIGIGVNWRRVAAAAAFALSLGLCALAGQMQDVPVSVQTDPTELLCRDTLASFGWESSELISQEQVRLPAAFDASYQEYLSLQEDAGFPLSSYAGKTVTRRTYRIENYPTGEENIFADLLIYRQTVIGGDIRTASLNGFMTSLARPEDSAP